MQVFISYEHNARPYADAICQALEANGYRCWYAPRNVVGDYATAIVNAINASQLFVLLVDSAAAKSIHVLNEVELAYQKIISDEIQIFPVKIDEAELSGAMEYYIKRLHWLDISGLPVSEAGGRVVSFLKGEDSTPAKGEDGHGEDFDNTRRTEAVQYYSEDDLVEIRRLAVENDLLFEYEKPLFDKLLAGKKNLVGLDYYCLDARASLKRFQREEFDKVLGFSYAANVAQEGNTLGGNPEKYRYFPYSQQTRDTDILRAMAQMGVDGFDFVYISMAVMDMKNPFKELKGLKKLVKPGAILVVRDVDDGIVFAHPDREQLFQKFKSFYSKDSMSGSRQSARQIFGTLKKIGAENIHVELCGINSASMDFKHKRMLFESWFSFIPNDFGQIAKAQPENTEVRRILAWLEENYDDLEEAFFDDDFFFNSGYMIFTASFPE